MRTLLAAVLVCSAGVGGYLVKTDAGITAASSDCHSANCSATAAVPAPPLAPAGLTVHEWGTFTSFSGSNGVPVAFTPNNSDLPGFVYSHEASTKSDRFDQGGTVSMETPVMYFYAGQATQASVQVDFPKGWITEWYPFASTEPGKIARPQKWLSHAMGETIRWNVKLTPGEPANFPRENGESPYYHARATDSVPLQAEFAMPGNEKNGFLRGASILQREKFLFYRGVGTFPPPVNVRAMGGGKVRVANAAGGKVAGLVLVTVRYGRIGFRVLDDLETGTETVALLPEANTTTTTDITKVVVKGLTAAGLYGSEAQAMVKTWNDAWFKEEGTRLLYLVPRTRTDELLPLTIDPRPTEIVRVLVGRHDFLSPEQESDAEHQMDRIHTAQAELSAAEKELSRIGRFGLEARRMAAERLAAKAGNDQK